MTEVQSVDVIKPRIRAFLLSSEGRKEPLSTFDSNFSKLYKRITPTDYGFSSLHQLLQSMPDVVRIGNEFGQTMLYGVEIAESKHIVTMIGKQKKPASKKKGRRGQSSAVFPRYRPTQFRPSAPTVPRNAIFSKPPPKPLPKRPSFTSNYPSQQPTKPFTPPKRPVYNQPAKVNQTQPVKALLSTPSNSSNIKDQPVRESVFSRLGPSSNRATQARRTTGSENEEPPSVFSRLGPPITPGAKEGRRLSTSELTVNTKVASSPGPKQQKQELVPVTPNNKAVTKASPPEPSTTSVVLVDYCPQASSDGSGASVSDLSETQRNEYSFANDPEFLRIMVRHLLASFDDVHRQQFTPSGIVSRMRRKFARLAIDVPHYMGEVFAFYMDNDWNDMFVPAESVHGAQADAATKFRFTPALMEAYQSQIKTYAEQETLKKNETHRVKITAIDAPAFYVTVDCDTKAAEFLALTNALKEEIDGDAAEDNFTYRVNELCAVYFESTEKYMRAIVKSYKVQFCYLDQSSVQLSIMAVAFLVDTGEEVTVPAGNLYSLPEQFRAIPPHAYRCIISGGLISDNDKFASTMKSHLNKEIGLLVFGTQRSDNGLILQVLLYGSSYIVDDLVIEKIFSRTTLNEPEQKPWPVNQNVSVRLIDWHSTYRSVLVQRCGETEERNLDKLESDLTRILAVENGGVRLPLKENIYVWKKAGGRCRRVRCLSDRQPQSSSVTVLCLDHGCRCKVNSSDELYLPQGEKVVSLCSSQPYFATTLKLAILPEESDNDLMLRMSMKKKMRSLCPRGAPLTACHDTTVSQSQAFMLYFQSQEDRHMSGLKPVRSLNLKYLGIYMDMRHWEEHQRFVGHLTPVDRENIKLDLPSWRLWIARFDVDGCSPSFKKPSEEFRYMESCSLEYTYTPKGATTMVMKRLSELPPDFTLETNMRLIYREQPSNRDSRVVRVILQQPYQSGSSDATVGVTLVDNPVDVSTVFQVEPHLLFTMPPEGIDGGGPLNRVRVDVDQIELDHFNDLLQHLPPLDQAVLTVTEEDANAIQNAGDLVELELVAFMEVLQRRCPIVRLPTT